MAEAAAAQANNNELLRLATPDVSGFFILAKMVVSTHHHISDSHGSV